MFDTLFDTFIKSNLGQKIKSLSYLPRWVIFILDVFIVLIANIITHLIISSLSVPFYENLNMGIRYVIIIFVNSVFFIFYRTYSGIIRHSTFLDGVKLLISTASSFLLLLLLNYSWYYYFKTRIFLTTGLFISFLLTFILLFLFRILVKFFFEMYSNFEVRKTLIRAVIYGADSNAIAIARSLKTEKPKRFYILGFIDQFNKKNSAKQILNLPIINLQKNVAVHLRVLNANALIIAEKGLKKEEIRAIVESCIAHNIKVYTVPSISDWEDQKQISNNIKYFEIEDLLERNPIVLDEKSIKSQLNKKTILISGAAGSIGSEITRQVLKYKPSEIIILDQAETPLHDLCLEAKSIKRVKNKKINIISILADIRNKDVLENVFKKYQPNVVYHAAAYKHVPLIEDNPAQAIYTNVLGTKNLADLAVKYNVEHFVMVSTDKAVNPSNVMGASKRIAEKYVQTLQGESRTKFITTRFGNVLGSNGSVVPLFTKQILEGGPVTITHPDIIRYFMTIPEACQLVLEAGAMGNGGEIFIFDMGEPVKIIDLAKKMIRLAGYTPNKEIEIKVVGLRPGEKLYEELLHDTSKTLPTHHEKILIAVEQNGDPEEIVAGVLELLNKLQFISSEEIVSRMKKIVPEFKSMNSVFESLD